MVFPRSGCKLTRQVSGKQRLGYVGTWWVHAFGRRFWKRPTSEASRAGTWNRLGLERGPRHKCERCGSHGMWGNFDLIGVGDWEQWEKRTTDGLRIRLSSTLGRRGYFLYQRFPSVWNYSGGWDSDLASGTSTWKSRALTHTFF